MTEAEGNGAIPAERAEPAEDVGGASAQAGEQAGDVDGAPARRGDLELRVAEVMEAGEHPNADRLLVLQVDLGSERRQLVAGLAGVYEPDSLVGRRIVVVANLKPARLRGEESQGMLLASHGDGVVGLLLAPDAEPGTLLDTGVGSTGGDPAGGGEARGGDEARITIDDFLAHDIQASADGVTVDGRRIERPRLVVDRDAWGRVK